MKLTIDTRLKKIQIHGSFKYGDFESVYFQLPVEWRSFEFESMPTTAVWSTWNPSLTYTDGVLTTTSNQLPLFNDTPPAGDN